MMLYARAKNYRSIGTEQTISFVANTDKSHSNILKKDDNLKILPVIPVYGGNATGKTNLLKFIKTLVDIVTGKIKIEKAYEPCKFYKGEEETTFEIVFSKNEIKYYYKLSYTAEEIKEEALYYYPNGKISKIFYNNSGTYSFGNSFESSLAQYTINISKSSCFLNILSTFLGDKIESLNNVVNFFKNDFTFINLDKDLYTIEKVKEILKKDKEKSEKIKEFIGYFYRHMNIGARGIIYNSLSSKFKDDTKDKLKEMLKTKEFASQFNKLKLSEKDLLEILLEEDDKIYLVYETKNGNFEIPIEDESEGIKKIFTLGMPLAEALCHDKIVVFDELEVGFHPLLARKIIELFLSEKNKAQLLFTTHNTNLLDLNLFRRDQIYFVSRTQQTDFKTTIQSLGQIPGVRKSADIEKAYLEGKYSDAPTYSSFNINEVGGIYEK